MRNAHPMTTLFVATTAAALNSAMLAPQAAVAAPGDLDTSFGVGGKVTTDFAGMSDHLRGLAIQGDGKIVAVGSTPACHDFALARYNTDGSLDTTFGTGGLVTTDFYGFQDTAEAVAIQADGKIVVAGRIGVVDNFGLGLARYNPNGTLDTGFGTGGWVTTPSPPGPPPGGDHDTWWSVAIQGDGKIVTAGVTQSVDFVVGRFNTDGSLDTTFGTDGLVTTDFSGFPDQAHGVAIQADGKIVAAGTAETELGMLYEDFGLVRYNANGTLDGTFGTGGLVRTDISGSGDSAWALAVQADGKIVAAGVSWGPESTLARYNPNGTLDSTFGAGGLVTGPGSLWRAVAIQIDGKILAGGYGSGPGFEDFAVARYHSSGTLDSTFGTSGLVTTDFATGQDSGKDLAIQADGKIVAGGTTSGVGYTDFALARYLDGSGSGACSPDADTDGIQDSVDVFPGTSSDTFRDASTVPQTNGRIADRGDQDLCVSDAPGDEGVMVESLGGGPTPATVKGMCPGSSDPITEYTLYSGESVVITCGSSITSRAVAGDIEMALLKHGAIVAALVLFEGNSITYEPETLEASAPASNDSTLILVTGLGDEQPLAPGETVVLAMPSAVPAVSAWGLLGLTLVLLVGAKVYFGRRRPALA